MRNVKKSTSKEICVWNVWHYNLSIDLHKRLRISADDTNQRNSEFEIRLSAVDAITGKKLQEDLSKGLSYK